MAGRFLMCTLQGLSSETCMGYDFSGPLSLSADRALHGARVSWPARGPLHWHRFWRSTLKLGKQDWRVELHELGLRQLERAGCFDGLDICDCAYLEDVVRQVQTVQCAYLQSHQDNLVKGHMVCPDLLDFASREVEKDARIQKQIRKAREERHLAQKNKKDDT